jgi:hypothetical protein
MSRYLPGITEHVPWRRESFRDLLRLAADKVSGPHRIPVIGHPGQRIPGLITGRRRFVSCATLPG